MDVDVDVGVDVDVDADEYVEMYVDVHVNVYVYMYVVPFSRKPVQALRHPSHRQERVTSREARVSCLPRESSRAPSEGLTPLPRRRQHSASLNLILNIRFDALHV